MSPQQPLATQTGACCAAAAPDLPRTQAHVPRPCAVCLGVRVPDYLSRFLDPVLASPGMFFRKVSLSADGPVLFSPPTDGTLPVLQDSHKTLFYSHDSLLSLSSFLGAISLTFIFSKLYSHFSRVTFHTPTLLFLHVCSKLLACKLLGGKAYG